MMLDPGFDISPTFGTSKALDGWRISNSIITDFIIYIYMQKMVVTKFIFLYDDTGFCSYPFVFFHIPSIATIFFDLLRIIQISLITTFNKLFSSLDLALVLLLMIFFLLYLITFNKNYFLENFSNIFCFSSFVFNQKIHNLFYQT